MFKNSPWTEQKQHGSNSGGLGHVLSCFKAAAPPDYPSERLAWDDDPAGDPKEASGSQICDCSQRGEEARSHHLQRPVSQQGRHGSLLPLHHFYRTLVSHPTLLPQSPKMCFPKRLQCQVVCMLSANSGGFAERVILWEQSGWTTPH